MIKPKLKIKEFKTKEVIKKELYQLDLYKTPFQLLSSTGDVVDNNPDYLVHSLTFIKELHMVKTARRWINYNKKATYPVLYYSVGWDILGKVLPKMILFTSTDINLEYI